MKFAFCTLFVLASVCACHSESGTASSQETKTAAQNSERSSKKEPKWLITVDGLPEKAGSVITAVTANGNGNYALARSGFTASISYDQNKPASMMFNFNKENTRCVNKDGAAAIADGGRAVISGEVLCYPKDGSFEDAEPKTIEGYFELKL